jgi:hypothetical protein
VQAKQDPAPELFLKRPAAHAMHGVDESLSVSAAPAAHGVHEELLVAVPVCHS